ncbi:LuxR C-terminal-related transcriptional regulator [Flavobacteriaceae bacterium 3-367]|uniref:helix-turn-helix transcriptional regulator n=1 Tax=Eudoraea algarum TaxID=3417568 RepID=UPI003286F82B
MQTQNKKNMDIVAILSDLVSVKILTPQDWSLFKEKFSLVYPSFFPLILTKGYYFTNSEERLLALEKLNLTTTHIANILGISPESVHTARYRLRKKLNVSCNKCIIGFLEGQMEM